MSNADPGEVVTASSDGVSVEKSFEPDDFPVPAIAFVLHAERDEAVSVRLVDTVPSHVPPEDIGFHPKYGAEYWGVEGDTIVFEREFEPGEEYTTVYGLRGGDAEDVEEFMTEPTIEKVDPPLEEADAGQTVRDVIGDTAADESDEAEEAVSSVDEDDESDDVASAVEKVDTDEEATDESDDMDLPDADGAASGAASVAAIPEGESLVSALAEEIRSGDVEDEAVEELRDALGVDLASASVEARIEHLQSSVSDLEAYTEALEEFLDENGDAQRLISDVKADFEEATERFDDLESKAEAAEEAANSVDDRLEEQFDELEGRLEEELDDVEKRVETALEDVEETIDDVDETVEQKVSAELDELWSAVDDAAEDVSAVSEELESLREEVGEATDDRIETVEAKLDELSQELDELAEMRDRLTSALGGLAPQSGDGGDAESESGGDGQDEGEGEGEGED